jgi:hypothetical protein
MTLLDTTKIASSWRSAVGKFGKGLIMDFVIEATILIGTLLCVLLFGPFWLVAGVIVFVIFYAWKRRSPGNVVLTYKCPNCGKLQCTEESVTN